MKKLVLFISLLPFQSFTMENSTPPTPKEMNLEQKKDTTKKKKAKKEKKSSQFKKRLKAFVGFFRRNSSK